MDEKLKLTYGMALVFIFFLISFGSIVINEQINLKKLPKAEEKIEKYINNKYNKENIKIKKTKYYVKCHCYKTKVTNKDNKNLYFEVTYNKKNITDNFNKNYKQGRSLLDKIEKDLTKEIRKANTTKEELDDTLKVKINKNLDDFNPSVKEEIIENQNDYKYLNIYNIEKEFIIKTWTFENINIEIINFNNKIISQKFNPLSYTFYITNSTQPGESFKIKNLKPEQITPEILNELVKAIKLNEKDILKKYNYEEE